MSVIIPARSRPGSLRRCVDRVLAAATTRSKMCRRRAGDDRLTALPGDDRLQHLRRDHREVGGAQRRHRDPRRLSLVFTDDDCTVPADWISEGRDAVLRASRRLARVRRSRGVPPRCGAILHCPHRADGAGSGDRRGTQLSAPCGVGRERNLLARAPCSPPSAGSTEIGPGSRFRACEEFDLYYRTLAAGCRVARDPRACRRAWGAGVRSTNDRAAPVRLRVRRRRGAGQAPTARRLAARPGSLPDRRRRGYSTWAARRSAPLHHERDRARSRLHGFAERGCRHR